MRLFVLAFGSSKRDSNTSKRDFIFSWTVWVTWKLNFVAAILKSNASFFEATIPSFCVQVNRFWNLLVCGIFNFLHLPLLPSTDMLFCALKFSSGVIVLDFWYTAASLFV
ncbi:hypothetical protein QL285_089809 [Trifolium repens]|nr:hypothetical protein QL285_089809 [Trifolium repens]